LISSIIPEEVDKSLLLEELKNLIITQKEKGNEYIQSKDFEKAKDSYLHAIHSINFSKLSKDEITDIENHLLPIYSNIAFCDISMNYHSHAIYYCKWVLDRDPENAKVNYRAALVFEDIRSYKEALVLYTLSYNSTKDKKTYSRLLRVKEHLDKLKKRKDENPWEGIFVNKSSKGLGF